MRIYALLKFGRPTIMAAASNDSSKLICKLPRSVSLTCELPTLISHRAASRTSGRKIQHASLTVQRESPLPLRPPPLPDPPIPRLVLRRQQPRRLPTRDHYSLNR